MFRRRIYPGMIILLFVMLSLGGCFFERLSWSPDGRYIAFTGLYGGNLWLWDSQMERTEELVLRTKAWLVASIDEKVLNCRYLPSGDQILVLTKSSNTDNKVNFYLLDLKQRQRLCTKTVSDAELFFDISRDGAIYYIKQNEEEKSFDLWKHKDGEGKEIVFSSKSEFGFPRVDANGERILYSTDNGLNLLNLKSKATTTLITSPKHTFYWLNWVDDNTILYVLADKDGNDELIGDLNVFTVDKPATRLICSDVHILSPPSVLPDGQTAIVTRAHRNIKDKIEDDHPATWQIASADITSGEVTWLTDVPFGAFSPSISPDGRRLAYLSGYGGNDGMLEVLDLKTRRKTIAWRNEEERLFATAESLMQGGDTSQALATWKDLLARFPESSLRDAAWYRIMMLRLKLQFFDIDLAFAAWKEISDNDLREQATSLFWRNDDRLATDPSEDWIQTYSTEKAQKEFGFNTDITRDLRALWVRWGVKNLYIRIDYGSNRDLSGLTFQDTLLLFDYDSNPGGSRRITSSTEWDREANRSILIRHWFTHGDKSQYDLEIRSGEEIIGRFLASGFEITETPVDVIQTLDEMNSVVLSISRDSLHLKGRHKINIQICTFKGGIESHKKFERPRITPGKRGMICDVADAFGSENTAEKIVADRLAIEKQPAGGAPFVIKGVAGTFVIE